MTLPVALFGVVAEGEVTDGNDGLTEIGGCAGADRQPVAVRPGAVMGVVSLPKVGEVDHA